MPVLTPSLRITGPGYDLETYKRVNGFIEPILIDRAIPFGIIGSPLPDFQQRHTINSDISQATKLRAVNPLPFSRWVGTTLYQSNQPQFNSVNEKIYLQG